MEPIRIPRQEDGKKKPSSRFRFLVCSLAAAWIFAACNGDNSTIPDRISLPDGFRPEGIAARENLIFVGSIPTGAVYRADISTGNGAILVPAGNGRAAIGLKVEDGRLFVAGGPTGFAFVYDADTGADLASYALTQDAETFVNDVVITADAAWFTDSRNPVLYRVDLPADGSLGGQEAVSTLALTGDFQFQPGVNNLNGIAATGDRLIVVQSNTGFLFIVDPATGITEKIDLGAETLVNGDGILLEGQTLFVVQNRLNRVAVVDLSSDFSSGTVRIRISDPDLDIPTTIAAAGESLYVVNARFGVEVTDRTPFIVVRLDRP